MFRESQKLLDHFAEQITRHRSGEMEILEISGGR